MKCFLIAGALMVTTAPFPSLGSGTCAGLAAREPGGQAQGTSGQVKSLDVLVLSTMLADRAGVGEWGFSALIETSGNRILFDTGARTGDGSAERARAEARSEQGHRRDPQPPSWRPRRGSLDAAARAGEAKS